MNLGRKFIKFFTLQKFRLDLSYQFIGYVNFILLVITSSPQIQMFLARVNINLDQSVIIPVFAFVGVFSVWFFGYLLDKAGYWQEIRTVQTYRNPIFVKILNNTEEIKGKLKDEKVSL